MCGFLLHHLQQLLEHLLGIASASLSLTFTLSTGQLSVNKETIEN